LEYRSGEDVSSALLLTIPSTGMRTGDGAWRFGRTYCSHMLLFRRRTRRDQTLVQCAQIWLHIYWVPVASSPRVEFLVRESKIQHRCNVGVKNEWGQNSMFLRAVMLRIGTTVSLLVNSYSFVQSAKRKF